MVRHLLFLLLGAVPVSASLNYEIGFEQNLGQAPAQVAYLARIQGAHVFFTGDEVEFSPAIGDPVRLRFSASSRRAHWEPLGAPQGRISYFIGNDESKWVRNASVFTRIAWRGIYPGIDAVFYAREGKLEYDLVLAPGADPSLVRIQWSGTAEIEPSGAIRAGAILQRTPEIYQAGAAGSRQPVQGAFVRAASPGEFRLALGHFDHRRTLTVDPIVESASFLGGEDDDEIVATGPGYLVGNTRSIVFPNAAGARRRSRDVFVRGIGPIRYSSGATSFLGTMIFGGSDDDEAAAAAIMTSGQTLLYIAGTTRSRDFSRTSSSAATGYRGGASDGFVAIIVADRSYSVSPFAQLKFNSASYIGGSGEDRIHAMAVTNLWVAIAGSTDSPDLITSRTPQAAPGGGRDAFYAVGVSGPSLYGYLGGSADDSALSVSWNSSGHLVVAGQTRSSDFPGLAVNSQPHAGATDAFLASLRIDFAGGTLNVVSSSASLIGGTGDDRIDAVACSSSTPADSGGRLPVSSSTLPCSFAGTTSSPDLPVRNAARQRLAGETDLFAGQWDARSQAVSWMTYWGGAATDEARAIVMNWAGDCFAAGFTRSADLPLAEQLQPSLAGREDGLLAVFDSYGQVKQSTYYGGAGDDRILAISLLDRNFVRAAGSTTSNDLPGLSSNSQRGTGQDGFYADLSGAYLSALPEIVLPKDGAGSISVRASGDIGTPITYRTSDASLVRLVSNFDGRSGVELTDSAEHNIRVEGLADQGEADITAITPGLPPKRIHVRLVPGQLVVSGVLPSMSTWSGASSPYLSMRAIDPSTNQPLVGTYLLRSGLSSGATRWTSSDPSVLEVVETAVNGFRSVQVFPRRPGTARLAAELGPLRGQSGDVAVGTPELHATDVFLGENLATTLSTYFTFGGYELSSGHRGTITLRSEDPSRVLVSTLDGLPREAVTLPIQYPPHPTAQLHGLASSGTVRVIATSTEFEGERVIPIHLEPAVLRVRFTSSSSDPGTLLIGAEGAVSLSLSTPSQPTNAYSLRPDAPPLIVKLRASNPSIVEVTRLTVMLAPGAMPGEVAKMRGLALGASVLNVTCPSGLTVLEPDVRVEVVAPPVVKPFIFGLAEELVVGKDLQGSLRFTRYGSPGQPPVRVSVDDPSLAVVSATASTVGLGELVLAGSPSGDHSFFVQALRAQGETRIHVRYSDQAEGVVKLVLVPSGFGVLQRTLNGLNDQLTIASLALEETTLASLTHQPLRPGVRADLHFRIEGDPVNLPRETATFDYQSSRLDLTLPPAAGESYFLVDQPEGFTFSPIVSRMSLARPPQSPVSASPSQTAMVAVQHSAVSLPLASSGGSLKSLTVRSLHPDRVLLSSSPNTPGAPEIEVPANPLSIYVHGLTNAGSATIRFEGEGALPYQVNVPVLPLTASFGMDSSGQLDLQTGRAYSATVRLSAPYLFGNSSTPTLSPGATPLRFAVRSTDSGVLRLQQQTLEIQPGQSGASVPVTAVAPGTAEILIEGPPDVLIPYATLSKTVANPRILLQSAPPTSVYLGRNLQSSLQLTVEKPSPSGAIASVTSSDPAKLVVSRSATALGSGSISGDILPNSQTMYPFYLQALEGSGNVRVTVSVEGHADAVFDVALLPSWLQLFAGSVGGLVSVSPGNPVTVTLAPAFLKPGDFYSRTGAMRAGLDTLRVGLQAGSQGVLSGVPETVELRPGTNATFSIQAAARGDTTIQIAPNQMFGDPPPAIEPIIFRVRSSAAAFSSSNCYQLILGRDTQKDCSFNNSVPANFTIRSEQPELLLVSQNRDQPGRAEISGPLSGFTIQGLGSEGTAEVVVSAPGFADLRIAVMLRPSTVAIANISSGVEFAVRANATTDLRLGLFPLGPNWSGIEDPLRAGLSIPVDISATPSGVISVEPARVLMGTTYESRTFKLRGLTPGTAVLRIRAEGYAESSASTLMLRVIP